MSKAAVAFKPRRGRPNATQIAAIERAILHTARAHFVADGYDAVAMEGVAAATGVSKGTLYARYPSKEALFTAVITSSVEEWSAEAERNDQFHSTDLGERLRHHVGTIANSLVRPEVRAFQRLLLATRDRFPELARTMYEVGYLYIVQLITNEIEAASVRDGIPVRDAAGIAALIVSSTTGWQLQEVANREVTEAEIARFGERTVELLLASRALW